MYSGLELDGDVVKFKFYKITDVPYIGCYIAGSFNKGEPEILFAMDFFTYTLRDVPKEQLTDDFKDGLLQTLTHEFCHAMQEFLDKEYDEYEVEKILGEYKESWNVFEGEGSDDDNPTFSIFELVDWVEANDFETVDELKEGLNKLFRPVLAWREAFKKHEKLNNHI